MKIIAIRHTSVAVEPGVCYGQTDVDVAKSFGEEQKRIVAGLESLNFDKIWSSPLKRCLTLAQNLFPDDEVNVDPRLKELNFGDWEMCTWEKIYNETEGKEWMENYQTMPTKNGESYPEMVDRVTAFVQEITESDAGNCVIVAHAGVIRILKSIIERIPISELFENFKPAYASITVFEFNKHD
ncbi:alpha-ribazole phosphatase [uncultured Draconibacterium sp.]|uniref:alpha-ribazole phosphatase n=1 Tax=uncultured Draconibacterium sp. TaxID=1573823 RepID=UPI0025F0E40A|nr:alpha-ribazole phosphatase [uncultured Draconibacterium sp.]